MGWPFVYSSTKFFCTMTKGGHMNYDIAGGIFRKA